MKDYYSVIEYLRANIVNVRFEKADGTMRDMMCTLNEKYLPEQKDLEEAIQEKEPNKEVVAVWDLEKESWRSFRLDRVVSMVEAGT